MEAHCAAYLWHNISCIELFICVMTLRYIVIAITEHSLHDALQTRRIENNFEFAERLPHPQQWALELAGLV